MTLRARLDRALPPLPDALSSLPIVDLRPDHGKALGGGTRAAVLIPVTNRPVPGIIFTQRTGHLSRHAGQVSFPGGKLDPGDDGALGAALREAEEEIALSPDNVELVGYLPHYLTATGFQIEPIVGIVPPDLSFVRAVDEVDAIFEVPLPFLLDPINRAVRTAQGQGYPRTYHEIIWEDRRIWGVTAAILLDFLTRIAIADAEPRDRAAL